jgi:hypothetical protein
MSSNTTSPNDRRRSARPAQHRHRPQQRRTAPSPRPIEVDLARIESLWLNRLEHAAGALPLGG